MTEVTGRDEQIIQQALSIAIPIMLRHSLSSSNTMDMIRILKERGPGMYPDRTVAEFLTTVIDDLKSGKTSELEKIAHADVFIITVPTPIKDGNIP